MADEVSPAMVSRAMRAFIAAVLRDHEIEAVIFTKANRCLAATTGCGKQVTWQLEIPEDVAAAAVDRTNEGLLRDRFDIRITVD